MGGTGRRSSRSLAVGLALVTILTSLVVVVSAPHVARAIEAPLSPPPACVPEVLSYSCLPADDPAVSISVSGPVEAGETITVSTVPNVPPCDLFTETRNCYFNIHEPARAVGCVAVQSTDPTDVVPCTDYSAVPFPLPAWNFALPGGGPCVASYDTTFGQGGPPGMEWPVRAPSALNCEMTYAAPRPDALAGATFWGFRTQLTVCEADSGPNCSKSRIAEAYTWVPMVGDLAPRASFKVEPKSPSGRFFFENTSVPFGQGSTSYSWTFGDGASSAAFSPTHTYTEPGTYQVRLTMTGSEGGTRTKTETVEVEPPELKATLKFTDSGVGPTVGVDDEFGITLELATTNGVGSISGVTFGDPFAGAPNLTVLSGPSLPVSVDMPPDTSGVRYDWRAKATASGRWRLATTASGTDAAGGTAESFAELNGSVAGLTVSLDFDPSDIDLVLEEDIDDGDGRPEPADVRVTVTLANEDGEPVEEVMLPETLKITDIDNVQTAIPRFVNKAGPFPPGGDSGPVFLGPLTLAPKGQPGSTHAVDYILEARDDGDFNVKAEVEYQGGGGLFSLAVGQENYKITPDKLLGIELDNDLGAAETIKPDRQIFVTGVLHNLSTTKTITVDMATFEPVSEGNAHTYFMRDLESQFGDPDCAWVPQQLEIPPGERVLIWSRIKPHPDGGTRAAVVYQIPDATIREFVETAGAGGGTVTETVERPLTDDEKVLSGSSEREIAYRVDTSVELKEWSTAVAVGYTTVGFIVGVAEWAIAGIQGVVALLKEITDWENWAALVEHGPDFLLKATAWYVENWLLRTPAERAVYVAEIAQDAFDAMIAAGVKLQDAKTQKALIESILPGWFDQVVNAYATNDPEQLGLAWGRALGNVTAEVISCIPFGTKYTEQFVALRRAFASDAGKALTASVKAAEAGGTSAQLQAIRRSVANGTAINRVQSVAWGVGVKAYDAILDYAKKNDLLITLRDRSPGAIRRLKELLPDGSQRWIEKMEMMKLKNMRKDLDGPLGYLDEHEDIVPFKKPISPDELEAAVAGKDPFLADEIRDRYATRVEEWEEWLPIYEEWKTKGFPAGFQHSPNGGAALDGKNRLPFRLEEVKNGAGDTIPDYYVPQVFIDGQWRGFTGDLDIVDIRRIDGSALSPEDASKVYTDLSKVDGVNLRHGDTVHWVGSPGLSPADLLKKKVEQLADYFVGGPDRALQFGPNGATAVQLDPSKTFLLQADNGFSGRTTYATWEGGVQHWVQDWTGRSITRVDYRLGVKNLPAFTAPLGWVLEGCAPVVDRSEGVIVRDSPTGPQLEAYENGEWVAYPVEGCSVGDVTAPSSRLARGAAAKDPVLVRILPQTGLWGTADVGATELPVHDVPAIFGTGPAGDWFEVDDEIIIGPGTSTEERRRVASVAPFVIDRGLDHAHAPGTMVTLAAAQRTTGPDPTTTTTTTTVPAAGPDGGATTTAPPATAPATTPTTAPPNGGAGAPSGATTTVAPGAGGQLPSTGGGSSTPSILWLGAVLIALGWLLAAVRRRPAGGTGTRLP